MSLLKSKDYKIYSKFLENLANKLTKFYYLKLDRPFKVINKNVASVWKDLSYVLTGETISNDPKFQQQVTGITISPKKSFCILKIWMSNLSFQNPRVITEITGLDVRGCLFKKHKPNY